MKKISQITMIFLIGIIFLKDTCASEIRCIKGSKTTVTEHRSLKHFNAVKISGAFEIVMNRQEEEHIVLTGEENIISHIVTETVNSTLHIYTDASLCPSGPLKIRIGYKEMKEVVMSGANMVNLSDIANKYLFADISGSGQVHLSGKSDHFEVLLSGASAIHAGDLITQKSQITITGTGNAEIYASKQLEASIFGAGNILCFGNPSSVSKNIAGVGQIELK